MPRAHPGPRLPGGAVPDGSLCLHFLENIFNKGVENAVCRNRSCWGGIYENDLRYYRTLAEQASRPKGLLARLGLR